MPLTEERVNHRDSRFESEPTFAPERPPERPQEVERTAALVTTGSSAEVIAGIAAVVLAIIGLGGLFGPTMAAVATIALGAAFLAQGASIAGRYSRILSETRGGPLSTAEFGSGMTTEFLGGAAGVVLGLLALFIQPAVVLVAVAVIVYGAVLVMGSGATARLNNLMIARSGTTDVGRAIAQEAVSGAIGAQVLVGLGGVILGILALLAISPAILTLVGLLAMGGASALGGTALTARMSNILLR